MLNIGHKPFRSIHRSVFELLLFFDQKDLLQEPLRHFTLTFQVSIKHKAMCRKINDMDFEWLCSKMTDDARILFPDMFWNSLSSCSSRNVIWHWQSIRMFIYFRLSAWFEAAGLGSAQRYRQSWMGPVCLRVKVGDIASIANATLNFVLLHSHW